jgi:hypothetical protein
LQKDCAAADILVNLTPDYTTCNSDKLSINLSDLKKNGTYAVYLSGNSLFAKNVREEIGDRPWNW